MKRRPTIIEHGLYDELPPSLRHKLTGHNFFREIQSINLFRDIDQAFASQLIVRSRPYRGLSGSIIYECGDIATEMTFILQGSIRIIVNDGQKDMLAGYSTVGGHFGDFEFYKKSVRTARYEAVQSCTLLAIEYSHFTAAIQEYPEAGREFFKNFTEEI